jgi:hypothetical protein
MGVLNPVEDYYKRLLAPFLRFSEHLLNLNVGIRGADRHHTLMGAAFRQLVQLRRAYLGDDNPPLLRLGDNYLKRTLDTV